MPNGDLPFADVSRESLAKLSNREVLQVHKRFDQSWRKREIMTVPLEGLSRDDFLSRFTSLVAELEKRELDRPDAEALDDAVARQNPKQEASETPLSEAFHLRDTHWIDVPESGSCPVSHPTKARFPGKEKQVCFTRSAAASASQARMREQAPEKIPEGEVNLRPKDFPTMKCSVCRYFVADVEPNVACKIVTRAEPELVCDAYQGATREATYEVKDEDWLAFVNGMVQEQPYQHIVLRGFLTPEGPIVVIRDTMKPKPHVFSLSKAFHLEHTGGGGEHGWTQEEVDRIIVTGGEEKTPTEDENGAPDVPEAEGAGV